jgi:ribonuclease R
VSGRKDGLIEGRIQHKGHFAFLLSETPGVPDLYLGGPTVRLAMDGDRVLAREGGMRGGRRMGTIVRVIERGRQTVVGTLRRAGKFWALVPDGGEESAALHVLGFAKGVAPIEDYLASLRIDRWPTEERPAGGTVVEMLGAPESPEARKKAILAARDIPTEFPEDALEEAEGLPLDPSPEDWAGRRELFDLPVFTIDGADAKDFDDAVSLEALPGGHWRLGVHIASVSDYIKPGTPLDREAVRRGTSVYLPGRVIPMLPPKISDHLCSLRPDVPRLTLTCWLDLSPEGAPGRVHLERTVIRSRRRFTYEEVQDLLDGKEVERVDAPTRESVRNMGVMAKRLTKVRMERGALDFATVEYKVKLDLKGEPVAVERRERLDSHRLIEEFMLAANEAVARTLAKARAPFLRRLHEVPDPARLEELQTEMGKLGIKAKTSLVAHPARGLQSLLEAAKGHPFEEACNIAAIRSLKLAVYSPEPGGHFGLASKEYCHFTSPIRRYPDLQVHRAVQAVIAGKPRSHAEGVDLETLGRRCSERERIAQEAERRSVDLARAAVMGREVGREFEGMIVNITQAGAFIALPESGAVGLWRGGHGTLGMRLKVKLSAVDEATGRLDFEPVRREIPGAVRLAEWKKDREHEGRRGRGRGRSRRPK